MLGSPADSGRPPPSPQSCSPGLSGLVPRADRGRGDRALGLCPLPLRSAAARASGGGRQGFATLRPLQGRSTWAGDVSLCHLCFGHFLTMEFPDLGKHCSEKTCKQLDFLPLKCDACDEDFCSGHFAYAAHKCPFAFKKVFTYRCSKEGCRRREMLRVACGECRGSFCIQHRHPLDHGCARGGRPVSSAGCSAARASDPGPSGASRKGPGAWLARSFRWKVKR
ncbi:AN1-type zinc finger protein 2A isoform X2 [Hippopotamus amphibius kiboko]|uniref:AN1-type zinc finger protein 2A isoform X2 n=1 Tax=Hippopotamus amphibius kiboko TaxID=575201 RepID=UPI00259796C1|nr:AN1-type zinc finger protein 2A isoform X2 [Hippopotamus amphibius kiboko]